MILIILLLHYIRLFVRLYSLYKRNEDYKLKINV